MAKLTKAQMAEREEALAYLRKALPPGSDVYVNITGVSRSGMSRTMRLYMILQETGSYPKSYEKPVLQDITGYAHRILRFPRTKNGWDLKVGGCGMDMAFHVVYYLGRALYPDGGPLDVSPRRAQEERAGHKIERDGGYLLNKRDL